MRRLLPRVQGRAADHAYHVAALRLQLLVAMADADAALRTAELERVARSIDDSDLHTADIERLEQLLRMLLDAPPDLDAAVARIVEGAPSGPVAEALVRELVEVARVDGHVDLREERLLRLLCGALGLEPATLYAVAPRPLDRFELAQLDELLATAVAS